MARKTCFFIFFIKAGQNKIHYLGGVEVFLRTEEGNIYFDGVVSSLF